MSDPDSFLIPRLLFIVSNEWKCPRNASFLHFLYITSALLVYRVHLLCEWFHYHLMTKYNIYPFLLNPNTSWYYVDVNEQMFWKMFPQRHLLSQIIGIMSTDFKEFANDAKRRSRRRGLRPWRPASRTVWWAGPQLKKKSP